MMKGKKSFIWLLVVIALGAYLFMTPSGALRLAVASSGHFGDALTLRVAEKTGPDEDGIMYYTLQNPLENKDTGEVMEIWAIHSSGSFYFGEVLVEGKELLS